MTSAHSKMATPRKYISTRDQPEYEEFQMLNILKPKFPTHYELQNLLLEDGRIIPGWYDGFRWGGYRVKKDMNIVGWKKRWV